MKWFREEEGPTLASVAARSDVAEQAPEVAQIFESLGKAVKTASTDKADLHFYIDPKLAEKYHINLHLADSDPEGGGKVVSADRKAIGDFVEETVSFPSKRKYEPNYLCSVVFQKPEDEVYAVSAYMVETYLGRYAFKANYYFKKDSRNSALRCYDRVLRAIRDLKSDFCEKDLKQNEVPHHLRRALQGEAGEVEPKSNKTATYLDPNNVAKSTTVGSDNIVYIPGRRSIREDLEMGE